MESMRMQKWKYEGSFCNIWWYWLLLEYNRSASAWEIPGQAARVGESSLTAREIPAEVSRRTLQISREIQDQGVVHKARTNCGRG